LEYILIFPIVAPHLFSIISSGLEQISSFFFLAPSRFSSFSPHLEQTSQISLLCSNYSFSAISTLGAIFLIQLALLQLQLFIILHTWSKLPKSACFAPIPTFHQSSRLEQAS